MKFNKIISIASILLVMAWSCKSTLYKNKFVLSDIATKTTIFPGVQGSPFTHSLVIKSEIKKDGIIEADSFWVDGYTDKLYVTDAQNKKLPENRVKKGDIVNFIGYYFVMPNTEETDPALYLSGNASTKAEPAKDHKGKMLIRFKINGKTQYMSISDIVKASSIYGE